MNGQPGKQSIAPFVRASILHIGAAAATASVREELTRDHRVTTTEVDRAYAVSRVTPGTNLLALHAQLGHQLGGWQLAIQAVMVGAGLPIVPAILLALLSEQTSPLIAAIMAERVAIRAVARVAYDRFASAFIA